MGNDSGKILKGQVSLPGTDRLGWFALLWVWAETIQPLNTNVTFESVFGWLLPIFAVALIWRPMSTTLLAGFLVSSIGRSWYQMPFLPNHILFMWLINWALLIALIQQWFASRMLSIDRERVFENFAGVARFLVVAMYLFAALAKLNFDFFDPQVSSAVALLHGITHAIEWTPGIHLDHITIYGVLFFEITIPVLLIFRKTIRSGVILAILFHVAVAVQPDWATAILTFSLCMFPLLMLFLPNTDLRNAILLVESAWHRWRPKYVKNLRVESVFRHWVTAVYLLTIVCVLLTTFPRNTNHSFNKVILMHTIAFVPHFVSILYFATVMIVTIFRTRSSVGMEPKLKSRSGFNACWIVAIVICVNGLCPYIGLKTTTAFTMFSNLRTEANLDNHLLIPDFDVFPFQNQMIEVIESNDPLLEPYVESGDWLTLFEMRRICSRRYNRPPFRTYRLDYDVKNLMFSVLKKPSGIAVVRYRLNGTEFLATKGGADQHDLFQPIPWYLKKFLAFRPVCNPHGPALWDH